jgi:hypothetical protein
VCTLAATSCRITAVPVAGDASRTMASGCSCKPFGLARRRTCTVVGSQVQSAQSDPRWSERNTRKKHVKETRKETSEYSYMYGVRQATAFWVRQAALHFG